MTGSQSSKKTASTPVVTFAFLFRPTFNFLYLSPRLGDMLGCPAEELESRPEHAPNLIHPADQDQLRQLIFDSVEHISMPMRVNHRQDGWVWMNLSASRLKGAQGDVVGLEGMLQPMLPSASTSELEAVAAVTFALGSALTRMEMAPILLDQVQLYAAPDNSALILWDNLRRELTIAEGRGGWALWSGQPVPWMATTQMPGLDKPLFCNNLTPEVIAQQGNLLTGLCAVACAPLRAEGEVLGALWMGSRKNISAEAGRVLFAIGNTAALALRKARIYEDLVSVNQEMVCTLEDTLSGWERVLELRHRGCESHTHSVPELAERLGRWMGLDEPAITNLRRAAVVHDIGKMGVPDSVLFKPGPLNEEEWQMMRQHPVYAYEILAPIPAFHSLVDVPYCHHERWDGSGYPRHLKGEEIPLSARIFAVIDVWDALSSDRVYRPAWPSERVLKYIHDQSGRQFDPAVVDAFFHIAGKS